MAVLFDERALISPRKVLPILHQENHNVKYRFFNIPTLGFEQAQLALNEFCSQHQVATLEKAFVDQGQFSYWSFCVAYIDRAKPVQQQSNQKQARVDYKQVLNAQDFTVFAQLRELRKTRAEQDGLPAYALFTNAQLAAMVVQRVTSLTAMQQIAGIGQSKIEKYAADFMLLLNQAWLAQSESTAMPSTTTRASHETPES